MKLGDYEGRFIVDNADNPIPGRDFATPGKDISFSVVDNQVRCNCAPGFSSDNVDWNEFRGSVHAESGELRDRIAVADDEVYEVRIRLLGKSAETGRRRIYCKLVALEDPKPRGGSWTAEEG